MSPEAQRVAIAEAQFGWDEYRVKLIVRPRAEHYQWYDKGGNLVPTPNYLADLNAMHEAEETLGNDEITWGKYSRHLFDIIEPHRHSLHATAAQKAKAFLLTLGKLDDSK